MKIALSPLEKLRAAGKFLDVTFNKRPITVSIEVTKRCNARCDFCDYWKISDRDEMTDFTDVVRRFDPLIVVFTGGEPMLRRDLPAIVKSIKTLPGFRYLTVLTHGGFLSEAKIKELVAAGVNQINISMNYPDARQDQERGIPGLFERLESTVPKMVAEGYNVFTFASMLMVDNMHDAEPLIRLAHKWGINIAFSGYNDLKNGNQAHFVSDEKMDEFRKVCARVVRLKRELGNVMTSDYFFEMLPEFYEKRHIDGCRAGKIMIHVSPKGMVQPCAELQPVAHYTDFLPAAYQGPNCGSCFDACRSEPQAPLTLRRIGELTGIL
ncbi:MAG: radical SAM protein [Deltaproteobacteria bacterium]|nr:MAG: radical SAM protein [Deltaproteobacteria bacterium]